MKKILLFLFLATVGFTAYSCDNNDDTPVQTVDNDTVAQGFDVIPNFTRTNNNLYQFTGQLKSTLVQSDVVLVYLQVDSTSDGSPVWRLLPYTFFTNNNTAVDYSFDFSKYDVRLNVNSTLDLSTGANSVYYTNKKFRVIIVPANTTGKNASASAIDYSDYNSVIKYYNIDESKIKVKN
ncbi:hypothetical protein [Chryseobacterium sp. OV279]|uniref:hypothetical protein n=1 Tax=Chryseobacterium sp. OV279 TaxID=1500285 RepID=UPI0006478327|nr:hypothetical protein [Chryseobacterium sp. OV279]SHG48485.1 hypothetical protein SAMN02787100_4220 [Chryseobacterium sp. OV279]